MSRSCRSALLLLLALLLAGGTGAARAEAPVDQEGRPAVLLEGGEEDPAAAQARATAAEAEAFSLRIWLGFLVLVFSATVAILAFEARRVTRRCAKASSRSTYSC